MRYLSLFSGIEAATVAWHPLGWHCVAVAEIEPFPCSVLAHHYPDVPNLGDVTLVDEERIALLGPIDLVVFGSPCQDLSVAGKRKGFADGTRSSLFFTALDIIGWAREHCGARFALWENVPGAFSSNEGRDFAAVVASLAGLDGLDVPAHGWGSEGAALGDAGLVEWATLDAQWFGVAQRRRRVFALADFGDWARRAPVLLEPDRVRGDSAPSRQAREDVAACLAASLGHHGHSSPRGDGRDNLVAGTLTGLMKGDGLGRTGQLVAFHHNAQACQLPSEGRDTSVSDPLTCSQQAAVSYTSGVRRLTPTECERLQGFPDDYTLVRHRGKPAADGPRYKALGNSMAVPVMRHIGEQIVMATL